MKWEKKGLIFKADGQSEIMNSHTTPVNAVVLKDRIRVFLSTRSKLSEDGNYISYPCYVDLDINNPKEILDVHKYSLLELGEEGTFDEYGIMIYKSMWFNNKLYLYYGGWQRLKSKQSPYQVLLGLAISDDYGKTFKKYSKGPVMGLDVYDHLSIGNVYPFIKDEKIYLYYTTYNKWEFNGKKATPQYDIKIAMSSDGITWKKENKIVIAQDEKGAVATPTVFKYKGKYRMLFGYRNAYDQFGNQLGYEIGYAESEDLLNWIRDDSKSGIGVSDTGWDSEMVCYPHVVDINGKLTMFYCGNGYGESGFGYAELIEE